MSHIKRLTKLSGTDSGFYILALHSYIERYLRKESPISYVKHPDHEFKRNMKALKHHIYQQQNRYNQDLKCIDRLISEHTITHSVRHEFEAVSRGLVTSATLNFQKFCRLTGCETENELQELEKSLELWARRTGRREEIEDLKRLEFQLRNAIHQNEKITQQMEEWKAAKDELAILQRDYEIKSLELDNSEARKESQSDKNKQLRQDKFELSKQLREKEKQMEEYDSLVQYTENLRRMVHYTRTRMDYERTIIRLSPEQKETLDRINTSADYLIKGPAGTGKTFLLLEAMSKAIGARSENLFESGRFLLLSYTKTLVKYNKYISMIMNMQPGGDDEIRSVDSYMNSLLQKTGKGRLDFKCMKKYCKEYTSSDFLSDRELETELENFIYWNGVTQEEYIDKMISRKGMKKPLNKAQREIIWSIKEQIEAEMDRTGVLSKGYSRLLIEQNLSESDIDTFFIDEVQDLSPLELKILKKSARKGVIMGGDLGQSIYGIQSPYKRSGIAIQGRTSILKTNFRSTEAIHKLANNFRGGEDDGESFTFRDGPLPERFTADSTENLKKVLKQRINFLLDELEYDRENLFILVPNKRIGESVAEFLGNELPSVFVDNENFDFESSKEIRISTLHSAKGLDMPVVLLFLPRLFVANSSSYDDEAVTSLERNLIYVSMTRAMDMLNVFLKDEPANPILDDLSHSFNNME
jgi:UvrD-like helicase C-terminal domain/UvrD/REP helicase N-terminal domain